MYHSSSSISFYKMFVRRAFNVNNLKINKSVIIEYINSYPLLVSGRSIIVRR